MKTALMSVLGLQNYASTEARHRLACAVLLRSVCVCAEPHIQVPPPQRLPLAVPRRLVGATDGKR